MLLSVRGGHALAVFGASGRDIRTEPAEIEERKPSFYSWSAVSHVTAVGDVRAPTIKARLRGLL